MTLDINEDENQTGEKQKLETVRFCPICGAQMYQGVQFGMPFWICPEGDYDEPI